MVVILKKISVFPVQWIIVGAKRIRVYQGVQKAFWWNNGIDVKWRDIDGTSVYIETNENGISHGSQIEFNYGN